MDFARKQLEKYGWKDGSGLGKECQGIAIALKPSLKTGKEGMGYDLCKDLTDTWWTKAYSDSLSRISVSVSEDTLEVTDIKIKDDDEPKDQKISKKRRKREELYAKEGTKEERPMEKMRKRMTKANFTSFSKGGTLLTNGKIIPEKNEKELKLAEEEEAKKSKIKILSDEELLKACGGRTAHKAARHGHKLNGKLARIAAQEEIDLAAWKCAVEKSKSISNSKKEIKESISISKEQVEPEETSRKLKKRKKDKKKRRTKSSEEEER